MGLLDELLGIKPEPKKDKGWDFSVFDNDRFKNNNSSNWVDWEDVSTSDVRFGAISNYDELLNIIQGA